MFDIGDPTKLEEERARLRSLHAASTPPVPDSVRVRDIPASPLVGPPVRVRLYEPRTGHAPVPLLLWVHGGAFAYGFAEIDDDLCLRLAADSGFLIASPDYRLSPEHPFPAGFDDVYGTLIWLAGQADILGVDASHIAVGGASAGGALAAGVCLRARDEGGPRICQQILACPVIDDRLATPSMANFTSSPIFDRAAAELMWQRYLGDRCEDPPRYAAPGREDDLSDLPPAYVLTADEDPLRDEGIDYAVRLVAAGNHTELHHVPDTYHSFDSIVPTAGVSQRVYQDYLAALQRSRQS
jgi:acetyl esterase/lipase